MGFISYVQNKRKSSCEAYNYILSIMDHDERISDVCANEFGLPLLDCPGFFYQVATRSFSISILSKVDDLG